MKTNTERAREQATIFVHKHQGMFAADIDFWIESITAELLQFQFNEFKIETV